MLFDDGPADRKSHAHSLCFGRVEDLKDGVKFVALHSWTRITHTDELPFGKNSKISDGLEKLYLDLILPKSLLLLF